MDTAVGNAHQVPKPGREAGWTGTAGKCHREGTADGLGQPGLRQG